MVFQEIKMYCCLISPYKLTALIFYARKRKNVHWIDISAINYFEVSHLLPVILGENYQRRKQPFKMYHNHILWSPFWIYALLSIAEKGESEISQICYNSSLQGG